MNRIPRWLLWSGLTLMVWVFAGWLAWGVLDPREVRLRAEETKLNRQQTEARDLLAAAPRIRALIDSVNTEIRDRMARMTTTDEIPRLLSELESEGLRHHLDAVHTELGLPSTLQIPLVDETAAREGFANHRLHVLLGAKGGFRAIGSWLDVIEDRADFREWIECRWEEVADAGEIRFNGEAEFWVVTLPATDLHATEDQGE